MTQTSTSPRGSEGARRLALLGVSLAWSIVAVGALRPDADLWGIDLLAYLPAPMRGAGLLLVSALFLPPISRASTRWLGAWERRVRTSSMLAFVAITAATALLLGAGLFSARVATDLHGDGRMIVHGFDQADRGSTEVLVRSPTVAMKEERVAPGAVLAQVAAGQAARRLFGAPSVAGIRALHVAAGALLAVFALTIVRTSRTTPPMGAWLLVLTLFGAPLALFCGYVENYPLFHLLALVTLALGWGCIHRRVGFVAPVLALLVTTAVHVQGVLLAPAVALALLSRSECIRRSGGWPWVVGALTLGPVVAAAIAGLTPLGRHLLPLARGDSGYAVLSPAHLRDVGNALLLHFPLLPLLLILAGLWTTRRERDAHDAEATERGFVLVILVPVTLFLVLIDPVLGMARDWDRFTLVQPALTVALLLMLRDLRLSLGSPSSWGFTPAALGLVLLTTAAWLGVLSSEQRTLTRLALLGTTGGHGAEHLHEALAEHHHARGDAVRAIEHVERAWSHSGNPRYGVRAAIWYEEQGRREDAYRALGAILERRPEHHDARFKLVQMLRADERWTDLLQVSRKGARLHPRAAVFAFFEGESLLHAGRRAEALAVFRRARSLDLPPSARAFVERTLESEEP